MRHVTTIFSLALLALSAACARDKDTDSYRRQKVAESLARLQVADGRYSGLVTSVDDGNVMGALELTLKAQTRNTGSGDNTTPDNQAVLVTTARFIGTRNVSVAASESYFDPDQKDFRATISVTRSSGKAEANLSERNGPVSAGKVEQISLSGRIDDRDFQGNIEVTGYGQNGGDFKLLKDGPAIETLVAPPSNDAQTPLYSRSFNAYTNFLGSGGSGPQGAIQVPASLVIIQPSFSAEEDFLDIFIPIKTVQITVNYSNSLRILHNNARWDKNLGTIYGSAALSADKILDLSCQSNGSGDHLQWNCQHSSSDAGQMATTKTFTASDHFRPHDDIGATAPGIEKVFRGTASFTDHSGRAQSTTATLQTILPARNREQRLLELFFPVKNRSLTTTLSLFPSPDPVRIQFDPTRSTWDLTSGTLDAILDNTRGAEPNVYTLACTGFYFDQTNRSFNCDYSGTYTASVFKIVFRP